MERTHEELLTLSNSEVTVTEENGLVFRYLCAPFNIQSIISGEDNTPDIEPHIEAVADICMRHSTGSKVSYVGMGMRVYGFGEWGCTHWESVQNRVNEMKSAGYSPVSISQ